MEATVKNTKIKIICGDISQQDTEAVVNVTNQVLDSKTTVELALRKAGGFPLLKECRYYVMQNSRGNAGDAVLTNSGNLQANYVIHSMSSVISKSQRQTEKVLRQSCWNCLLTAQENGLTSLSLPPLATGLPVETTGHIMLSTIKDFLMKETILTEIRIVLSSKYDVLEYENLWKKITYHTTLNQCQLDSRNHA